MPRVCVRIRLKKKRKKSKKKSGKVQVGKYSSNA